MKTSITNRILPLLAASTLVVACSDSWEDKYNDTSFQGFNSPTLHVSVDSLLFADNADSQQIEIQSTAFWTATTTSEWLQLSSQQGKGNQSLTITTTNNTNTTQNRTAVIVVSNGMENQKITVVQKAMTEMLKVEPASLSFSFNAASKDVAVLTNVAWTASSNASWLTVKKNDDATTLVAMAQSNISVNSRSAVITIKGVALSATINVSQSGVAQPSIADVKVSDVQKHQATCRFTFTSADIPVTEYGVCYSNTNEAPDVNKAETLKKTSQANQGKPDFTITELKSKTNYYLRAYIVTEVGIQYSPVIQFMTPASKPNEDDNPTPKEH